MTYVKPDSQNATAKRTLCWGLVTLGIIGGVLAAYWPLAAQPEGSGLLGAWDVFSAYGPWLYFTDHRIHEGEFPLWDPLTMCGQPFAANPQNLLFYPPNLLRSALTFEPTPLRTHVGFAGLVAIHVLIGGIGIAALSRKHGIGWTGVWSAAIVFTTSSQYVERLVRHPIFIFTIAWLPWLLLTSKAIHTPTDGASRYRAAIGAGLLFGLIALAGFPQLTIYCAIALFVFYTLHGLFPRTAAPAPARTHLSQLTLPFILIFAIGGGLAMASYLPTQEFAELSARQKGRELAVDDYVENEYTPTRIVRSFLIYPGLDDSSLKIAGTAALILAFAAAWHPKRRTVLLYAALLYAFIDCAIGPPMPVATITAFLTPFRIVYPDYACFVACLPLAMLAGLGADALRESTDRFITRVPVLALALAAFWIAFSKVDDVPIKPGAVAMVVPGLMCCVLGAAATQRFKSVVGAAALVLVVAEVAVWTPAFIPHLIDKWGAPPIGLDALRDRQPLSIENRRGATFIPNTHLYDTQAVINGYNPLLIEDTYQVVCPPGMEDRYTWWLQLEVVQRNRRGNLFLKRPFWLARNAVIGPLPPKDTSFPPTTTTFLAQSPEGSIRVIDRSAVQTAPMSANHSIVPLFDETQLRTHMSAPEMNRFQKLAVEYAVSNVRHPGKHAVLRLGVDSVQAATILCTLTEHGSGRKHYLFTTTILPGIGGAELVLPDVDTFDLELTLLFDASGPHGELTRLEFVVDEADEGSLVDIEERSAGSVRLNVGPLEEPRMLLFTESHYPGWIATVDGTPVRIVRANDAFMAVPLDPGHHDVVFEFRPQRVYAGISVSLLSFAASVLTLLYLVRVRRKALHTLGLN